MIVLGKGLLAGLQARGILHHMHDLGNLESGMASLLRKRRVAIPRVHFSCEASQRELFCLDAFA